MGLFYPHEANIDIRRARRRERGGNPLTKLEVCQAKHTPTLPAIARRPLCLHYKSEVEIKQSVVK